MNRNLIRPTGIGVTAGVVAAVVTVAGLIAWEDYDPWDRLQQAIARQRLSPAERAEFDRLQAARTAEAEAKTRAEKAQHAETRAKFQPYLISTEHPVAALDELSAPMLIRAIEQAAAHVSSYRANPSVGSDVDAVTRWSGHLDALRDEFRRRRTWENRRQFSHLDQLRMEAVEKQVYAIEFAEAWATPTQPAGYPPYPSFEGPGLAEFGTLTDTFEEN
ncbi:hypothetical protein [Nocardia sp. CA-120079]|uniref:hypothetical protein n=1 Tax=Nocardia sp. CA-120079 TaxID=3239974 RepID=UPI003D97DC59